MYTFCLLHLNYTNIFIIPTRIYISHNLLQVITAAIDTAAAIPRIDELKYLLLARVHAFIQVDTAHICASMSNDSVVTWNRVHHMLILYGV